MKIILRLENLATTNYISEQLMQSNIKHFEKDNMFNNLIYLYDVNDMIVTEFSYIIKTKENQITINKDNVIYLSIKNEKE